MTSANVVEYRILFLGTKVGHHYQSLLCKTKWHQLLRFNPPRDFEIQAYGYDEEEAYWEGEPKNLRQYLEKVERRRYNEEF